MARPKKDKEHKLSKVVVIRLTEGELKQLEEDSIMCSSMLLSWLGSGCLLEPTQRLLQNLIFQACPIR
jgi:hypothetical protein